MANDPAPNSESSMYLQDREQVQKVFDRFDANSDGQISADELGGVLKALGSGSSAEEVGQMMTEIDTDKDGSINIKEFAAFCKGDSDPYNSAEKELREAFKLYDQDHDGKISAAELHKILTQLGQKCSIQDCAGMIKSVDSDGDGYVCFEEFRKMMTANKNSKTSSAE